MLNVNSSGDLADSMGTSVMEYHRSDIRHPSQCNSSTTASARHIFVFYSNQSCNASYEVELYLLRQNTQANAARLRV